MAKLRKRYYFWLFKAYVKRWKRTILSSVVIGAIISIAGIAVLHFYILPSIDNKIQRIGILGVSTPENLPESIVSDVSYGLTQVTENGSVIPAAAERWEIKQNGKEYIFHLKRDLTYHNGKSFNAETLNLNFNDAKKKIIDEYTVSYTLQDPYIPFLTVVSKPILLQDFSGLGTYSLSKVELNAGFVKSLVLQNVHDKLNKKIVYFYPTQASLKTAYMLGEVDVITGANTHTLEEKDLSKWTNTSVQETVNYNELVTVFYNNTDSNLSNKKYRQALNYALPEEFEFGERAFSPIPPNSMYFSRIQSAEITDKEIAQEFLQSSEVPADNTLEISTTSELEQTAQIIAKNWKEIGVNTHIVVSEDVPQNFQVLLYKYRLPRDPDQYTLWHSDQVNNIGKYKNLRIDKLLEDGRIETDSQERMSIYAEFQKYLLDDVPASFLYFPREYRIVRR